MNLEGNQRGGGKACAAHFLSQENDHVEVYELRGFVSDNLHGAMNEIYAVSRGTKCSKYLYSLSVNPPPQEKVSTSDYIAAIDKAEQKLGLSDQPRGIVFHEKEGRRHAHVVWSRIDSEEMKAVHISHDHLKLKDLSRELYLEHGWKMPEGYAKIGGRDPKNFSLSEWQRAKRKGYDPREVKAAIQDAWAMSDSGSAFISAMNERGLKVARGDRAGIVAVNIHGDVQSIPRALGRDIKLRHVRDRLGDETALPSVDEVKAQLATLMSEKMKRFRQELAAKAERRKTQFERKHTALLHHQKAERTALTSQIEARQHQEVLSRQARFSTGLRGVWDALRGEHKRIRSQNEQEAYLALQHDQSTKDNLVFKHLGERQRLNLFKLRVRGRFETKSKELSRDLKAFEALKDAPEPSRRESRRAPRNRGPTPDL